MAKMTVKPEIGTPSPDVVEQAVNAGKAILADGKPKIEAAMRIYTVLLGFSQDDVISAFIEGASLTPKGAVTYWYNCRRKHSRMKAAAGE